MRLSKGVWPITLKSLTKIEIACVQACVYV